MASIGELLAGRHARRVKVNPRGGQVQILFSPKKVSRIGEVWEPAYVGFSDITGTRWLQVLGVIQADEITATDRPELVGHLFLELQVEKQIGTEDVLHPAELSFEDICGKYHDFPVTKE